MIFNVIMDLIIAVVLLLKEIFKKVNREENEPNSKEKALFDCYKYIFFVI